MLDLFRRNRRRSILLSMALLVGVTGLAACGGGNGDAPAAQNTPRASAEAPTEASAESPTEDSSGASLEQITIGISMYLLVDDLEDPDPAVSSVRTEEELVAILERMNEIWGQANLRLELATLDTLVVDRDVLKEVGAGNIRAFFDRLDNSIPFDETSPGLISGFYTRRIGGPNGITPLGSRWYMVMDQPSVFDHRVSSHEVGHILGLRHTLGDRGRLLYPGTNGMSLTPQEITRTRYVAMEMLKAQR